MYMNYYIFDRVPGYHPKYTFAVLAVSSHDARQWMRNVNKGGTLVQTVAGGQVQADMGALTPAAEKVIREKREEAEAKKGAL